MNVTRKSGPSLDQLSLASLLNRHTPCGVIIVDGKQKIRSLTAGAEQFTGIQARQALNRDAKLLPAVLRRILERVSASGKPVEDRRITLSAASGKTAVLVTAVPLQTGKARSSVALVLNNNAALRKFEQNVHRLDRLASIGTLSTGMAHEIKNALVSVKTFIDLLLDRNQDAELADVVRREMRRINSLVGQTLQFAGPARPTLSAVRLHDVLDQSLRMVQPQIQTKLVSLQRLFQAATDVVHGDDYQIEQVFVNLFLNAIEAMNSSGSLTIATEIVSTPTTDRISRNRAPYVRVTVTDTGMGITPANMNRLFEPFFTTKVNGTGLGLAIARQIVKEHKGDIQVRSEVNKGTTFSVLFPSHVTAGLNAPSTEQAALVRAKIPQQSRPRETF